LKDGVFYEFCDRARGDASSPYIFIIDEINRGNVSKVFGELLMLIEADKRGPEFSIPLTYSKDPDDVFYVPENVYVLGLMNTADRSLAMVDYALRRRFAFARLAPAFNTVQFSEWLRASGVDDQLTKMVVDRMSALNAVIVADTRTLGPGFQIGHSFFCPTGSEERLDRSWYDSVIRQEIEPLLREYWFDDHAKVDALVEDLLR
jgi:5-methylcytosine-specific restriction protein B